MPWRAPSLSTLAFMCIGALLLSSCATPESSHDAGLPEPSRSPSQSGDQRHPRSPNQADNMHLLRVRKLVIPQDDLNRYPDLMDARVGKGLSQLLVDVLTETRRFNLTVAPDELVERLSQTWKPGSEGLEMHTTPSAAHLSKAFQLFVVVFDIAACQPVYRLTSAPQQTSCRSSVGVQVRIEAPSGQFVPGATHPLAPQGRYLHRDHLTFFGTPDVAFSQSGVGMATAKAIQYALLQALERLDRQGW